MKVGPVECELVCPDCGDVCIATARVEFSIDSDGFMHAGVVDLNTDVVWQHYYDKHMTVQEDSE